MSLAARPMVGGVVNVLAGGTASDTSTGPAYAAIVVKRNGTIEASGDTIFSNQVWHRSFGTTVGDAFWVRLSRVSGSGTFYVGSTIGSWHQLSADRTFSHDNTSEDTTQYTDTYTIEISSDSSGTPVVSASASGAYTIATQSG